MASRRPFGFKQSVSVKDMREQRLLDAKAATGISQKKQRKTPSLSENRRPKIQAPPPRGERLRVVKAVQEKRKVKGERDMSYQVGQAVMVGGMGAGTGLFLHALAAVVGSEGTVIAVRASGRARGRQPGPGTRPPPPGTG